MRPFFLNGGDVHGLFHNLNHFISQLIDGVLIFSIVFHNTIVMIFVSWWMFIIMFDLNDSISSFAVLLHTACA